MKRLLHTWALERPEIHGHLLLSAILCAGSEVCQGVTAGLQ